MKLEPESLILYAVTDSGNLHGHPLADAVRESLEGGVTFLQYREKHADEDRMIKEASELKGICVEYHVPFVINDSVELALRIDADGVHVGQSDQAAAIARNAIGPDKILGVSVQTVAQALQAEKDGADYLGVGAVFPTDSKSDAVEVSHEILKEICDAVSIPVVAIGGIHAENIFELKDSGIAGIAVISAIYGKEDTGAAAAELRDVLGMIGLSDF